MGTPQIAAHCLNELVENNYNVVGVITSPDKPAGRGLKVKCSEVKEYALSKGLNLLQPTNLKDPAFTEELQNLKPDLQIVVAFRMLPKSVWSLPTIGTFNMHASLLPNYRGAAPINWAIINGDKKTGVTTFFINEEIDMGGILLSKEVEISQNDDAGTLHDKLMIEGSKLIIETLKKIEKNEIKPIPQSELLNSNIELKPAPKIFKETCLINWEKNIDEIYDFIRGLSPYPSPYTFLISPTGEEIYMKIYKAERIKDQNIAHQKNLDTDGKKYIKIHVKGGIISLLEIQLNGKKKMHVDELLRGFSMNSQWKIKSI